MNEMKVIVILALSIILILGLYVIDEVIDYKLDKTKEQLNVVNRQYDALVQECK